MPLYNSAFLEIFDGNGNTGTFEFSIGFEPTSDINKSFLMGDTGQYVREIINQDLLNTGVDAGERRTGFWIDGGAGDWEIRFKYKTGLEDIQWGDGSGGTGAANVTKTDASGEGVKPLDRQQIAANWVASTRTDSLIPAHLHWGQYTDGSLGGATAGAFNAPMLVAVKEFTAEKTTDSEGVNTVSGTVTVSRLAPFPDKAVPDFIEDYVGKIEDDLGDIPDA